MMLTDSSEKEPLLKSVEYDARIDYQCYEELQK
jgi:hypothetical protein